MSETKTLTLEKPLTFGRDEIKELSFHEPRARDFWSLPAEKQTVGDLMQVAASLCGQPPALLSQLDILDMTRVLEIVSDFMPAGLRTPTTP